MSRPLRLVPRLAILAVLLGSQTRLPFAAVNSPDPKTVTIAGTLQSELGCDADWMPACDKTFLSFDSEDDV